MRVLGIIILIQVNVWTFSQSLLFDNLSIEQGLSQGNVLQVLQDKRGFIWFATEDGLNRYDGCNFVVFKNSVSDSTSISNNYIKSITEDKNGLFWIGTQEGLNCYNPKTNKFKRYLSSPGNANSLSSNNINNVCVDDKNNVWIATDFGLNLLNAKTERITRFFHDSALEYSLADNYVRYVIRDRNNKIWIATNNGLSLFNKEKEIFTNYNELYAKGNSHDNRLTTLLEDSKGNFWIGTFDHGLLLFDRKTGNTINYSNIPQLSSSLSNNYVYCISEDKEGELWIGTANGLNKFDRNTATFCYYLSDAGNENSLKSNVIASVFFDVNNRMWLGTRFGGVSIYDKGKQKFKSYKNIKFDPYSLNFNIVTCFAEDEESNIWVGTDGGGLNYFDKKTGKFTHITQKNGLTNDKILTLLLEPDGKLWIGLWDGGINLYDTKRKTFKYYKYNSGDNKSLSDNNIFNISKDNKGNIWVGTWGNGLNLYQRDTDSFKRFIHNESDSNSITNSPINYCVSDNKGQLWIVTELGGIDRFDWTNAVFKHFKSNNYNSLSGDAFFVAYCDKKGRKWFGTNGKGIALYNDIQDNFTVYSTSDGLINNVVYGILEDNNGYLWLSTNGGISRFDPQKRYFKNYTEDDGLQSNQFGRISFFKSSTDELYFGGINGFSVFHPDSVIDNDFIPPIYLTKLKLFNEDVQIGSGKNILHEDISYAKIIELKHKQNILTFEFAALNYRMPEKNQYAYKLVGFNDNWIYLGNEHKVTFTNLDPGEYELFIKASNNDGVWNEKGIFIKIIITPPFWKTWWFRVVVILAFSGLLYFLYSRRMAQIKRDKSILESKIKQGEKELAIEKQKVAEHELELVKKEQDEKLMKWHNDGLLKFSGLISLYRNNIVKLPQLILVELVNYVGTEVGAIFLCNDEEAGEQRLYVAASYGIPADTLKNSEFIQGEGWIGACFSDKKTMICDNLPEKYVKLESGFGETNLRHIVFVPIKSDDIIEGVIELASYKKIDDYRLIFIEKLAASLAAVFSLSKATENMQKMLKMSEYQAEELRSNKEELYQNLEEIQAAQDEANRKENILQEEIILQRNQIEELVAQINKKNLEISHLLLEKETFYNNLND